MAQHFELGDIVTPAPGGGLDNKYWTGIMNEGCEVVKVGPAASIEGGQFVHVQCNDNGEILVRGFFSRRFQLLSKKDGPW